MPVPLGLSNFTMVTTLEWVRMGLRKARQVVAKKQMMNLTSIQALIDELPGDQKELIRDGYHSFKELYDFRRAYNAALFNLLATKEVCDVYKSWKHADGEWCFGEPREWFIVTAMLPTGQVSNHYEAKYWDDFKIQEVEVPPHKWDGHTGEDVLARLLDQ